MSDFATFSNTVIAFVATYFVHSTLLLAMCWLTVALLRPKSHFLAERLWKLATVLGILTAFSQVLIGSNSLDIVMQSWTDGDRLSDVAEDYADFEVNAETVSDPLESGVESEDVPIVSLNDQLVESTADSVPFDARVDTDEPMIAMAEELDPKVLDADLPAQSKEVPLAFSSGQYDRAWLPNVLHWCAIVLVCVFVAGGLLLIVQTTRLRIRFGSARVLRTGIARNTLDRFLRRHKIRGRIRLLASNKHCEPIAFGLIRWTIVLPEGAEERLEQNELKALLAHEVAHLVRGDVRWLWIGRVLCTCCAFQPLNFLARRRWQHAAEYLCDDWALERGIRSLSLARCLTRVAEWRFGVETSHIGLAAGGSKATLVQRVKRLVEEQPQCDAWKGTWRRRGLTMGAAIAVVTLVGFTPRIALPRTLVAEHASEANSESISVLVEDSTTSDWHTLEEEILQLERDLERVDQLRRTDDAPELASRFDNLIRRAASLHARREYIASLIEEESQR